MISANHYDPLVPAPDTARRAHQALADSAYFRGRLGGLEFIQRGDTLIVLGAVPSFFLKQHLQEMLKGISGVARVENYVDVVSVAGLSSVRTG